MCFFCLEFHNERASETNEDKKDCIVPGPLFCLGTLEEDKSRMETETIAVVYN